MPQLPGTDLTVSELCLGGNVFGWTADEATSFAVLDRYLGATPGAVAPFVDTAESYTAGESERILGAWMADRGVRDLRVDTIDLYYAHWDDETTPLEETLQAFDELVQAGKVRHVVASNYSAKRLTQALETSDRLGVARYQALQTHYNLMEREEFEGGLRDVVTANGLGVLPYYSLAKGFLTGKYRAGEQVDSVRAEGASAYVGEKGDRVLTALRTVADARGVPLPAVALRWLADQ